MNHDHDLRSTLRQRLAEMRKAGYCGPSFLRGRPAYEYLAGKAVGTGVTRATPA